MIDLASWKDRSVAVLGLGKSGLVAARALAAGGARVAAWDDNPKARAAAAAAGVMLVDFAAAGLGEAQDLVISPGIPHSFPKPHPVAALARARGVAIIGDIELLFRSRPDAAYIGITGTNGKSTTTALTGHILRRAGRRVQVGGNIGEPALGLEALDAHGTYVLEMSSYQLETTPTIVFDAAVLLNITPDHLDRHGGMDGYIAAKRRIFERQTLWRSAVIGVDDPICARIAAEHRDRGIAITVPISSRQRVERGVFAIDGILYDAIKGVPQQVADLRSISTLPGAHNWQNAAAAYAVARARDVPVPDIVAGLATYPGLPHRQQLVGTLDGVRFVNDSKATNADAAARALGCYDAIYWIAGGRQKEGGITTLGEYFPRIRRAYLVGEAAGDFARTLDGKVATTLSGDLATAVRQAAADARRERIAGAVVLLSPACASWDQFPNFEVRGETFAALVAALAEPAMSGDRA